MAILPDHVRQTWEDRDGPAILAAVSENGGPCIIYVTCVAAFGDDRLIAADNYFDKARKNPLHGSKSALPFRNKTGKAYQVKGSLEYHTEGEAFDHMKTWNPPKHPGHFAAAPESKRCTPGPTLLSQTIAG